jgi:hypothetical protein
MKTIVRKRGSGPLGQRDGLSPKDAQELNRYYECNGPGEENTFMGVPGGVASGAAVPPVCWANKASRAIFASQSGNILAYYKNKWDKFCQFCEKFC